jgi:hypothetical protein
MCARLTLTVAIIAIRLHTLLRERYLVVRE